MIEPHGGGLVEIERKETFADENDRYRKIPIATRNIFDCEMIANGGFSPLKGFMTKDEAQSVIENVCLSNGTIWSIPILLPINKQDFDTIALGEKILLTDQKGNIVALMKVEDKFELDLENYCKKIYKTTSPDHPGVKTFFENGNRFVGGEILAVVNDINVKGIANKYILTPKIVRREIEKRDWKSVVAFQTRNPIHRAHEYIIKSALEPMDGVLIHPLVGRQK